MVWCLLYKPDTCVTNLVISPSSFYWNVAIPEARRESLFPRGAALSSCCSPLTPPGHWSTLYRLSPHAGERAPIGKSSLELLRTGHVFCFALLCVEACVWSSSLGLKVTWEFPRATSKAWKHFIFHCLSIASLCGLLLLHKHASLSL